MNTKPWSKLQRDLYKTIDEKLLDALSADMMFPDRASLHAAAVEYKRKYDAEITGWNVNKNPRRIPFIEAGTDALLFVRISEEMLDTAGGHGLLAGTCRIPKAGGLRAWKTLHPL
jgi:hypothetical protein